MAIAPKHRDTSFPSSPNMKQWKPPKKVKLFSKKLWASSAPTTTSHDQEAADSFVISKSIKSKRTTVDSLYVDLETQSFVMARAKEVQANLSPNYPSLIKVMLPSHVAGGFWLGLPRAFCNRHLPKQDTTFILEDESGIVYDTKYLSDKAGLSAGWRGFSITHKLLQGDVIVFHLVMPSKFMVYIVRCNAAAKVDGALVLLKYKVGKKQTPLYGKDKSISNIKEEKMTLDNASSEKENVVTVKEEQSANPVSLANDINEEHKQTNNQVVFDTEMIDGSGNDSKDFGFQFASGIRLSDSVLGFDKVRSSDDFSIFVNGLIIDSEFSKHLRTKYYDLCCSQKSFLHDHLLEGLNCKLVSGMISETVNIADAIRACKISTSQEHLTTWDRTLKAFEGLGMNVGFLRSRINQLTNIGLKSEKKREAKLKQDRTKEEVSMLEEKLVEARETVKCLEAEIQNLDNEIGNMEHMFQEVARAPW